jgi:hypothetical protein
MHNDDAILGWLASIGAGGVEEVAAACGMSPASARARLRALERDGLARQARLLHGEPALHVLTRRGLRAAGRPELGPVTLSASGFAHHLAVARVAVALGREHGAVQGERELRALERAAGRPLASAELGWAADGSRALHRPDLLCWDGTAPIAVEVELTAKAPDRLRAIVRAWARSRDVAGVVYYASAHAARAVAVAVRREQAGDRVALLGLGEAGRLPGFEPQGMRVRSLDRRVPSQALRTVALPIDQTTARRPS